MMKIHTVQDARMLGLVNYFNGELCRNGHRSLRKTSTQVCIECRYEQNQRQRERRNMLASKGMQSVNFVLDKRDVATLEEFARALILARKLTSQA